MRSLRNVLAVAAVLAAFSVAQTVAQQKEAPPPKEDGQDGVRKLFTDLAEENVKLRKENKDLRADNEALKRKLEEYETLMRRQRENRRGAFVPPPETLDGQQRKPVPPGWKPFEFNGETYYLVPLNAADGAAPAKAK